MTQSKFVICIENTKCPASLAVRRIYQVLLGSDAKQIGHIRVTDDAGEHYLYPSTYFIDARFSKSVEAAAVNAP